MTMTALSVNGLARLQSRSKRYFETCTGKQMCVDAKHKNKRRVAGAIFDMLRLGVQNTINT